MNFKFKIAIVILVFSIGGILFYFLFLTPPKTKECPRVIRIGYNPYLLSHGNIFQALKHLGSLEKMGHQVKFISFTDAPTQNQAFLAGDLDIGFGGDMPTVTLLASGARIKIIALGLREWRVAIIVDKEKEDAIRNINDLIGRKVGTSIGSSLDFVLHKALKDNGIDPKKVNIVNMKIPEMTAALITIQVDAIVAGEPIISKVTEVLGLGRVLFEGKCDGFIYVNEELTKNCPETVQFFIDALEEAVEYTQRNFSQTLDWLAEEMKDDYSVFKKPGFNPEKLDSILVVGQTIKPESEAIAGLKEKAEFLLARGFIKNIPDFSKNVDYSFINKTLDVEKR